MPSLSTRSSINISHCPFRSFIREWGCFLSLQSSFTHGPPLDVARELMITTPRELSAGTILGDETRLIQNQGEVTDGDFRCSRQRRQCAF